MVRHIIQYGAPSNDRANHAGCTIYLLNKCPMSNKPFTFTEFKKIYLQVPRLCVDLMIRDSSKTLLTLRKIPPNKNKWHLPGGTVLFGETLNEAIHRIANDELGVDVEVEKFLGYIEFLHQERYGGFDHPVSLVFLCSLKSKKYMANEQAHEIKFHKQLPANVVDEHKEFLENRILK